MSIACVLGAGVLSLMLHGYALHGGDNEAWLAFVHHAADPALLANDPFVSGPMGRLSHHVLGLGMIARAFGVAWSFFVIYLLAHFGMFAAVWALSRELLNSAPAAALSTVLLALARPIGGTATLTVEAMLIPRQLAGALGVAAMVLALRARPRASGALLGLTMLVHPLTALPCFAAILGRPLLARGGWRPALETGIVGTLVSLPVLVPYAATHAAPASVALSNEQWWAIARNATPFAFVGTWSSIQIAFVAAIVALLLAGLACSPKPLAAAAFLPGPLAFFAIAAGAGEGLHLVPLAALQGGRGLFIVAILAIALAAAPLMDLLASASALRVVLGGALGVTLLAGWWGLLFLLLAGAAGLLAIERAGGRRALLLLAAAACLLALGGPWSEWAWHDMASRPDRATIVLAGGAAALVAMRLRAGARAWPAGALAAGLALVIWRGGVAPVEWPWQSPANPASALARWARESTPASTRFIAPFSAHGLRSEARRAVMLDRMDEGSSLFSRAYAAAWLERERRFGPGVPVERLAAEIASGAADVLVVPRDAPPLDLPVVYEDARFRAHARAGWLDRGP